MKKTATLSPCGKYRYVLAREWAKGGFCVFIGLNPSTADAEVDDPTIRRCVNYARAWGYGKMVMLNAYAYRATDPVWLKRADDPVGSDNDMYIKSILLFGSDLAVACWGANIDPDREKVLKGMLDGRLHYLRLTKDNHPSHPLYLPKDLTPNPWVY